MPKMKTHRGAAKRFKKTGTGKFKRGSAFKAHILTSKTRSRKRKSCEASTEHGRKSARRARPSIGALDTVPGSRTN